MTQLKTKTLTLTIQEPTQTFIRDLSKILSTVNALYNYYSLFTVPDVQRRVEARLRTSTIKKPKALLYSSSLERFVGRENRMTLVKISHQSPMTISIKGIAEAIDALRHLVELFSPVYWTMRNLEKEKKILQLKKMQVELMSKELDLKSKERNSFEEHCNIIKRITEMKMPDDLKQYLLDALNKNLRAIELNPIKAMI